MRLCDALVVALGVVLLGGGAQPVALAQEEPEPAVPDDAAGTTPDTAAAQSETHNGLYVAVGYGLGSAETFNTSILTDASRFAASTFEVDEMTNGIVAVGWKLKEGKGDFRLVFNGYSEESYEFEAVGAAAGMRVGSVSSACDLEALTEAFVSGEIGADEINASPGFVISPLGGRCLYGWWGVSIKDGQLRATRTPSEWTPADDLDEPGEVGDEAADPGEIRYLDPDREIEAIVPDNLQNNVGSWDALYGREFGGRRFSSRWWGGLRYFKYTGQMLGAAWLAGDPNTEAGTGFTDHAFLRLIGLAQETSGFGPVGSWEADFNFYNKGLVFYLRGEAAFTFNSLEADSGTIFAIVGTSPPNVAAPVRIHETRDKSSWQVAAEVGVRVRLRRGFEFELGYTDRGYLDVVLLPSQITLPTKEGQIVTNDPDATLSALYASQDFEVTSWHALVGFQF